MNETHVRVGVIGRGFGGRVVAPLYEETEGYELVDVVTPRDEDAVRALCARDDVDLISVHSPPFMHLEHVRYAVGAGHAVICDKPFGRDAAEASEMRDLARDAGVVNLLYFEFRYDPARERLRALVHDGAVGEPDHFHYTNIYSGSRAPLRPYKWLFDKDLGGGWLGAAGSHIIDFVRWAFGDIVDVSGLLRTTITERPDADGQLHHCTADDGFIATLRSANGVTSVIDSTFAAPVDLPPRLVIVGEEGVLELTPDNRITRHAGDGVHEEFQLDEEGGDPLMLPMRRFAVVIRDAVRRDAVEPGTPTFADGLACREVMDRIGGVDVRVGA